MRAMHLGTLQPTQLSSYRVANSKLLASRPPARLLRHRQLSPSSNLLVAATTQTVPAVDVSAPTPATIHSQSKKQPLPASVQHLVEAFEATRGDPREVARLLVDAAKTAPPLPVEQQRLENRVLGCTAQVWVTASLDPSGCVQFAGGSDSLLSHGIVAVLASALSGLTPSQLLAMDPHDLLSRLHLSAALTQQPQGSPLPAPLATPQGPGSHARSSRAHAAGNVVESMWRKTRGLVQQLPRFPSLLITPHDLHPQGAFAEAQAEFLKPQPEQVAALVTELTAKRIGVVAHFYMDPQVQGVLSSAAEQWPHIAISDSLVMADTAVRMARAGCRAICVLGVDFMSENVRAILDDSGFADVAVYRLAETDIGCSLAEAAESLEYLSYLDAAGSVPNSLHVVYINTSLYTKAAANERLPTITCTSSNVVQTVLQAFAQVPDATVWYGPDTYMGRNLAQLFTMLAELPDEEVQELHPQHTAASIRALLPRLHYYEHGTCIVHHLFGGEVCELVKQAYGDAYLTAHFEVPGEMFSLAMAAKRRGMGVVGSTSNILDFIADKVQQALGKPHPERLQFVLGTESGMITSIVRKVQNLLQKSGRSDVDVEIVFPVNPNAITTTRQSTSASFGTAFPGGLTVLPGPAMGEGCSLEGGCASCPYMRMNTLSALSSVCARIGNEVGERTLQAFKPRPYAERMRDGATVAQAGCVPILHMRSFQQHKQLSEVLITDMMSRHARRQ
ncbi:hypothetical protein V8C86DRAFT_2558901 [Haematococcus lacustris]